MNEIATQLAIAQMKDNIPQGASLEDRLSYAMREIRQNASSLLWTMHNPNDDVKLCTALGAVMVTASEEEKDLIKRSLKPLQALSAILRGVPVDVEQIETDNLLPIMKLWHESIA